jgi:4-amino-4-deoxy-L-arabinose transferase-like glycosyltransferase
MPLFIRLSATATTDIPVTLCATLVVFLLMQLLRQPSYGRATLAGVSLGVGFLCKYTMALLAPVLIGLCLFHAGVRQALRHVVLLITVAGAVVAIWVVLAVQSGVWKQQLGSLAMHASQVTTSRSGRQWMLYTLRERVVPAVGWYNLPVLALGVYVLVRQRTRTAVGVLWWLAAPSALLVFTLPDPRYFLLVFPALAITLARGVTWLPQGRDRVLLLAVVSSVGVLWMAREWHYIARLFLR